jgi:8-oxo-dGTP diphosphatase
VRLRLVRATQGKFTVSVAAIVTNDENKVLLLKHVLRPVSDWGIPGGFIETGEQPEAAIRRELMEETGLELDELNMLRVRTIARHIEILFRARARGEAKVSSREITDLGWFAPDEMPEGTSGIQKHLIEEILKREV